MYELPRSEEFSFLLGKELIQVCYGKFQTQLHFSDAVSVSIETNVEHKRGDEILGASQEREQTVTSLIMLLGVSVNHVAIEQNNVLMLSFSNDQTLRVIADGSPYESFSVTAPGHSIVV